MQFCIFELAVVFFFPGRRPFHWMPCIILYVLISLILPSCAKSLSILHRKTLIFLKPIRVLFLRHLCCIPGIRAVTYYSAWLQVSSGTSNLTGLLFQSKHKDLLFSWINNIYTFLFVWFMFSWLQFTWITWQLTIHDTVKTGLAN